jgi:hypothetical protein
MIVFYAFLRVLAIGAVSEWKNGIKKTARNKGRRRAEQRRRARKMASSPPSTEPISEKMAQQPTLDFGGLQCARLGGDGAVRLLAWGPGVALGTVAKPARIFQDGITKNEV